MQTTTALSEALGRYLDLASDQMKVTIGNMANVDTPGFKTQGFNFEQEFLRQQAGLDLTGVVGAVDGDCGAAGRQQRVHGPGKRATGAGAAEVSHGRAAAEARVQRRDGGDPRRG